MMAARLGKARDDGTPGGYCRSYDRVLGGTTAIDRDIVAAVCMQLTAGCDYAQNVFERYDQYAVQKSVETSTSNGRCLQVENSCGH